MILEKVSGATNSGQLTYSAVGACQISTYPMLKGNDRLILIVNKGVQFLKFDSTTNTLKTFGANGNLPAGTNREFVDGLIVGTITPSYYIVLGVKDTTQSAPAQHRIESYVPQFIGKAQDVISAVPTMAAFKLWTARVKLSRSGGVRNPDFPFVDNFKLGFLYIRENKRHTFHKLDAKGQFIRESDIAGSAYERMSDIVTFPGAQYYFILGSFQGTGTWTPGTTFTAREYLICFYHQYVKKTFNSDQSWFFACNFESVNYPFGDHTTIAEDGFAINVGNHGSAGVDPANIVSFTHIMNTKCNTDQAMRITGPQFWNLDCPAPASVAPPFCNTILPLRLTCLSCNPPSGGTSYTLVDSAYYSEPTRKSCVPSTLTCTPPNYPAPNANSCYNCPTRYPNCKKCFSF